MFLIKPKLPIEPKMRDWVDGSMRRFVDMFGVESLTTATVATLTDACFPDAWDGSPASVEYLFARVCGYMGVSRDRVKLTVFEDEDRERVKALQAAQPLLHIENPGAAGLYGHSGENDLPTIAVDGHILRDINRVIATMAHELGHALLLGGGLVERDAPDMEPLTDLITVYRGLGIFTANCANVFSQHSDGTYHGWSVQRLGYLSEPTYGYALAVFASMRRERNPRWLRYLKLNVRTYFKQSAAVLASEGKR